ncbi:MAG TPA: bifunctional UDP-N-acetylglucosamine diphosphorylase/glucosamine-1-phosphate N-acetyltransferase GlmU [Myxococcota bacterium]|nr:bifunctional UDP-N-acetylglucosamine diphosphorylase/glucosamine-1-phosphate N-acetyltransferase GlmU [Myxococcota bacterium]
MTRSAENRPLAALVLAAGKGTRLKSARPKVLHEICGRPLLGYSVAAAEALEPARLVVVVGPEADEVRERFAGRAKFAIQAEPRGTGHAVLSCREALDGFAGDVVVLYGDTPLLRGATLARMRQAKRDLGADVVLLSAPVDVPGIVVRDAQGRVARIIEVPDATPEQLEIRERNTGVYLLDAELCWKLLARVGDDNAQGEVYLTDIVELAVRDHLKVEAVQLAGAEEALGVNTRAELVQAMDLMRKRIANRWLDAGVTIVDPAATYIDADVEIGQDTTIEPGCVIQGPTRIGARVHLKPHCTIESSRIGDDVEMGPCAHLRPNCDIGDGARIGNFVEVKNSVLGPGVKADHLSYIGDADVGERASFGCGSVVVNYDGKIKHRTKVGPRAFIGCNANLVAPLEIEADSYVAAGSTITTGVPEGALAVARARQRNIEGWVDRRGRRR